MDAEDPKKASSSRLKKMMSEYLDSHPERTFVSGQGFMRCVFPQAKSFGGQHYKALREVEREHGLVFGKAKKKEAVVEELPEPPPVIDIGLTLNIKLEDSAKNILVKLDQFKREYEIAQILKQVIEKLGYKNLDMRMCFRICSALMNESEKS